ncbi:MAG: glycosyltransferase [Candidatus Hydrogenedentes bacterium]|nr:glycosyltransferase [Candidatus Hydrogenedentota bacterium]
MTDTHERPPLVSIVIATYAGDSLDHLGEAVESALLQTHRNIEVLVAADGPLSIEAQAYLSERAQQDPRIVLLSLPENRGPGAARNLAIARARGAYIAILDADDRAKPYRVERQLAFIQESGADLVGSAYTIIDDFGGAVGEKRFPLEPDAIRAAMYLYNPIANSTAFARATVLKKHAYPEAFRYGEDYALWIALARAGCVLRNQPDPLVEFRCDTSILARRRGLHCAITELTNKLHALPLYPAYKWPLVAAAAVAISLVRLLPAPLLNPFYRIRKELHRERT